MKQSEDLISCFDTSYEFQRKVENMLIEETRKKMKCDNLIESGKKSSTPTTSSRRPECAQKIILSILEL